MRFQSTGLGETELIGEVTDLTRDDDHLTLHIHTSHPVRWRIRASLNFRDILVLAAKALRLSILRFLIASLFGVKKSRESLEEMGTSASKPIIDEE